LVIPFFSLVFHEFSPPMFEPHNTIERTTADESTLKGKAYSRYSTSIYQ